MKKADILRVVQVCSSKLMVTGEDNGGKTITVDNISDLNVTTLCTLWSGMGHIYRVDIQNNKSPTSLIIKHVAPRKCDTFGDQRKAKSYQVEANFYEKLAPKLINDFNLNIPYPYYVERKGKNEMIIAMSYIHSNKKSSYTDLSSLESIKAVLKWLATLHGSYWGENVVSAAIEEYGIQNIGCYWHLDTRPDEHASMPNRGWEGRLKRSARAIDNYLKRSPYQCIIHGDAKDANVLINNEGKVALCDFQYCGKGPPTRDIAYFFCSSVSPNDEEQLLEYYLQELTKCIHNNNNNADNIPTLSELKDLLDIAYCDFYRFMSGWGYWGSGGEDRVKEVLNRLDNGKLLSSEDAYDDAIRREYG